jgi:hypothetical protein
MVLRPDLTTPCARGSGLAACPALGVLVASHMDNTLTVFDLADNTAFPVRCTLGGDPKEPSSPMRFKFGRGGFLAFTPSDQPLLLVTDGDQNLVHVIDLAPNPARHVGHVAKKDTLRDPRGVATRGSRAAVVAKPASGAAFAVFEFELQHDSMSWTQTRRVDTALVTPYGVRFCSTEDAVVVADYGNWKHSSRVRMFYLDGTVLGTLKAVPNKSDGFKDLEVCEDGWLIANSYGDSVEFVPFKHVVDGVPLAIRGKLGCFNRELKLKEPRCLAWVPGVGLVVRDGGCGGQLLVFETPLAVRTAWTFAVYRASSWYARKS